MTVFPLPLSPFEAMMVEEDRRGFPQTAVIELDFQGRVDEPLLNDAWEAAIARHPLSHALIAGRGRAARWIAGRPTGILWTDSFETADGPSDVALDLTAASGVRLSVARSPGAVHMRLHVHHAVCDGAGAFQLLEDFFRAYDNLCQGRDAAFDLREVDASRLARRHRFAYRNSLGRRRIHDVYVGVREAAKFVFRSPVPLAPSHAAAGVRRSEGSLRGTASVVLTRETIAGLRRAAARRGATVHDILVRDAFLAMHAWNADFGCATRDDELLRLLSPCDLRCRGHESLPAANVMAYAFYTRRTRHCENVDALTDGVIAESNYIRNENASMYFIRCLEVAHAMPGAISRLSNASRCYATMVLSNLGEPWRFAPLRRHDGRVEAGQLRLLSVRPYSPIRSGTHAAIVACQYGQQATLGLSFNASRWDQDAGRAFLRLYQRQLEISAGSNLNNG